MQVPLAALSFLEKGNRDDLAFKESVNTIYEMTAKKKSVKVRSLDEVIAPYAAIPLSLIGYAFPTGSNVLTKSSAYVTKILIGICVFVFVLGSFVPIVPAMSLVPIKVSQNMEWHRIITYAFLHGGIAHLLGNMWFLWVFGKVVEDNIGWKNYLMLFLISAVFSAALFIPTVSDKTIPCVGASGAISGVIATYLILCPKVKIKFTVFWRLGTYIKSIYAPAWGYILAWIALNIILGIMQSGHKTVGVAYWGHIGGFIAGIAYSSLYKSFKQVPYAP